MSAVELTPPPPPPHSIEAEECLLSCCLLEGSNTIARCIELNLPSIAFYAPANRMIYEKVCELYQKNLPVDTAVLGEELKTSRQLDAIGGFAYITQISGRVPTTAQAQYFIDKLRDLYLLRRLITVATGAVENCYSYQGGLEELIAHTEQGILAVTRAGRTPRRGALMEWDALFAFDSKNDPDCLMGARYLCRTGGIVVAAPSGIGKSVLALQWASCAALGKYFFGMKMTAAMRVLYVQAEDDIGDVAEAAQGFRAGLRYSEAELDELRKRLRIVRWNDAAGEKFLSRLRAEFSKWPFDLVVINPLFSFAGCNIMEQSEISPFLRNGLNPILNETGAAAIVIHHTNKPPRDKDNKRGDVLSEIQYSGSGSAELTNWARAVVVLQPVPSAGDKVFKMIFAKRGNRTGIVDEDGRPTSSVMIEHSTHGLCWLPSDYRPEKGTGGKFESKFDMEAAARVYDSALSWRENEATIAAQQGMSGRAVRAYRRSLEAAA